MVRNHLCYHYTTGLQNKNRMQRNIPTASMAEKVLLTHTLLHFTHESDICVWNIPGKNVFFWFWRFAACFDGYPTISIRFVQSPVDPELSIEWAAKRLLQAKSNVRCKINRISASSFPQWLQDHFPTALKNPIQHLPGFLHWQQPTAFQRNLRHRYVGQRYRTAE